MPRLFLRPSRGEEEEEEGSGLCGVLHAPERMQQQQQQHQSECEEGKTSSGGAAAVGRAAPSASFNQDASCIAVAEKHGFCIFSADPLGLTFRRELHAGVLDIVAPANREAAAAAGGTGRDEWELVMVEMLYTCNLLALVGRKRRGAARETKANEEGGGKAAAGFPTHAAAASSSAAVPSAASSSSSSNGEGEDVCALWDDRQAKVVVQVQFRMPIRGVQLLKEVLLIILDEKICVYRLHDLCLLDAVPTCCNPTAICAAVSRQREHVSSNASEEEEGGAAAAAAAAKRRPATAVLLACPAVQKGQVQLLTYIDEGQERASREEGGGGGAEGSSRDVLSICAHDNPIAFVCLSADGQLLGTASTRGTLFRIFDTSSGALLLQLRRGSLPAQISCLAFSPCREFFACCSSTGTAHIYKLQQQQQQQQQDNTAWGQQDLLLQRATAAADEEGGGTEGCSSSRVVHAAERKQNNSSRMASAASSSSSGFYAMLGTLAPPAQAERSFAQFKLPAGAGAAICTFGRQPHTLLVLTAEKLYYKLKFDEEGRSPITVAARDEIFLP